MDVYLGGVLVNNLNSPDYLCEQIRNSSGTIEYDDGTQVSKTIGSDIVLAFGIGSYNIGSAGNLIILFAVKLNDNDVDNIGKTLQKAYIGFDGEFIMVDNIGYTLESVPQWLTFVVEIQGQDYSVSGGGET